LMIWPGVLFLTSLGTRDWAETGVGKSKLAMPKSNRKVRATDKTRFVIVLLFMVLPACYFTQFHLTSRQ
jgi:hypothetical protein